MDQIEDVDDTRFLLSGDHDAAELVYRHVGDRLVLIHTEVPEAWSGRGIGGRLVHAAVDRAVRDGLVVVPWCPFARRWLRDHPEVADRVTIDWKSLPPES